jgi:replicative DNA helicase
MINLDAERSVVCSILVDPKVLDDVSEILESSDFSDISYGLIYGTLKEMPIGEIDIINLAETLGRNGVLDQIGGMQFLSEIYQSMSTSSNVVAYARVVKEGSKFRSLSVKLRNALITIDGAHNYDDAVAEVNGILSSIEVSTNGYLPFDSIIHSQIKALDARYRRGGGFEGVSTGFGNLDNLTRGLNGGDYFIIGARPSMGKTAFSLALAENIAGSDGDVLYFSVESTKESLTDRMIASSSGVDATKIKSANLLDQDWVSLTAGVTRLKDLPIHFIDIPSIDISHASAIARKFNRKKKLKAIFIDYIQLMTAKGCKSEYETVSVVSRGLKALAKDCDAPVIALAQLSREVDKRPNKRPNLSDLRATGQLEQDGDIIGFLYRDEYYNKPSDYEGVTELGIQKNRDGSTGEVFFSSNLSKMRYKELDYKPQQPYQDRGYKPFRKELNSV